MTDFIGCSDYWPLIICMVRGEPKAGETLELYKPVEAALARAEPFGLYLDLRGVMNPGNPQDRMQDVAWIQQRYQALKSYQLCLGLVVRSPFIPEIVNGVVSICRSVTDVRIEATPQKTFSWMSKELSKNGLSIPAGALDFILENQFIK